MTSGRSSLGWIVGLLVLATPHILSVVRAADPAPVPQGINHGTREGAVRFDADLWHYSDQGSGFFPMSVVEALEDVDAPVVPNEPPLMFLQTLDRFGLLPGSSSVRNPRGLPVGIVTNEIVIPGTKGMAERKIEMFGFTCAACHTSDLHFNGQVVRVDGASGLLDVDALGDGLGHALEVTLSDRQRFQRFFGRMIDGHLKRRDNAQGPKEGWALRWQVLRNRLKQKAADEEAAILHSLSDKVFDLIQTKLGKPSPESTPAQPRLEFSADNSEFIDELRKNLGGFLGENAEFIRKLFDKELGQVDRFLEDHLEVVRHIVYRLDYMKARHWLQQPGNRLRAGYGRADDFGTARVELFGGLNPKNLRPVNAPVSVPPLWNVQHYAWIHWNSNTNSIIQRSMGEAIGVGATFDLVTKQTSVNIWNQMQMELEVHKLTPPAWPAKVFGAVDQMKAASGAKLYQAHCEKCHSPLGRDGNGLIVHRTFTLEEAGTDRADSENFDQLVWLANGNQTSFAGMIRDLLEDLQHQAKEDKNRPSMKTLMNTLEQQRLPVKWRDTGRDVGRVYPARPLEGIWATAPYLHNGSVPTLYHLLLPARQRPVQFEVGQQDFDPVYVGFEIRPDRIRRHPRRQTYVLDTKISGNLNIGHEGDDYGTNLSDEQRFDLIEYLKIHQDPMVDTVPAIVSPAK